jgi:hypothetical protein
MSKYVEYNQSGGLPLVKAYSRREACDLFSQFTDVRIEVDQLVRAEVYYAGRFIPEPIFKLMRRSIGWNVIITAVK